MARTPMTVTPLTGDRPPVAKILAALAVFDNALGMTFKPTGREIIELNNPTVGALTYTFTAVDDAMGRAVNYGPTSIAAGATHYIGPMGPEGWAQGTGTTYAGLVEVDASGALLYAVLETP